MREQDQRRNDGGQWRPDNHWPEKSSTTSRGLSTFAGERTQWFSPVSCRKR